MLDEEWESVLEEIVRSLLKGDAFEGVPETLVSFLKFLREGFVRIVSTTGHVDGNTER